MANVDLVKEIYGINTYSKAVNITFSELKITIMKNALVTNVNSENG